MTSPQHSARPSVCYAYGIDDAGAYDMTIINTSYYMPNMKNADMANGVVGNGANVNGQSSQFGVINLMQGLDTTNRSRVLKLVESVCRAGGTTLVYITHHYEEVLPSVTQWGYW